MIILIDEWSKTKLVDLNRLVSQGGLCGGHRFYYRENGDRTVTRHMQTYIVEMIR